jgi:SHS2 domain-containing protein
VHRWKEHTGELELELEAATPEGVFEAALAALAELLSDTETGGPEISRAVEVEAGDPGALLVRWIDELVFLAEMEGLVPGSAAGIELAGRGVRATVKFRAGSPPNLVKGATYHRLSFEQRDGRWHATVVLDV